MKKGRPYYYAVESARVNGKPRIVRQKYLGTVDGIVERMERTRPERPREAVLFEAVGAAALLRIAQRLDLMGLIDAAVPKRAQGPSVELAATPPEQFREVSGFPGTKAFAAPAEAWGKSCRAILVYTESFFTQQLAGVTRNLVKCQKKLLGLEKNLGKWREGKMRGKRPTVRQVQASVRAILRAQFMDDLFDVSVTEQKGLPKLHYGADRAALDTLTHQRLGRTLLLAAGTQADTQQTIATYRSLTQIEEVFKNMKNVDFLRWQPAYRWTEQKLKVHGFYCVLALLLATLARKLACQAGLELTLPALLEELTAIREVAVIYPQGTLAHPKDHITLSRMSSTQRKLADALDIATALNG